MMKSAVRRALRRLGYDLRRTNNGHHEGEIDTATSECINVVRANTMLSTCRLTALLRQAVFCEQAGIPGAFVECGVWKGGAVGLMALANLKHGAQRRPIHLFDSFEEICEPDASVDGERAVREVYSWSKEPGCSGQLRPLKGLYDWKGGPGTLRENRELLETKIGYPASYLHYHVGWFQHTLPIAAGEIGPIAILRIDADWHASTKVCLDHLYDQVSDGGFVIVDDYGAYDGCRKAVDEFLAKIPGPLFLHVVDHECCYWIKHKDVGAR